MRPFSLICLQRIFVSPVKANEFLNPVSIICHRNKELSCCRERQSIREIVVLSSWVIDLVFAASTRATFQDLQLARLHRMIEQRDLGLAQ